MDSILALAETLMASPWLLLLVLVLAVADSLVPMVPAETVVLTAGTFAVTGSPSAALLVVAAWAGALLGDVLAHHVGRGAGPLARRLREGRIAGAVIGTTETALRTRGAVIILGARFVPGARTAVNLTAGATGMPRRTFVLFSSVASLAWSLYYVGIGMLGGLAFAQNPLLGVALGIGLALVLGGILELVRRIRGRRAAAAGPRRAASAGPGRAASAGTGRASAAGPARLSRSDRAARGACPAPARGAP
jgi:membrane-associated protein